MLALASHGDEHFHVQAFIAQLSVKALNVAVLHRPSWPNEGQMHADGVGPQDVRPSSLARSRLAAISLKPKQAEN